MIKPEVNVLFLSLTPIHQVLCLQLIDEMNHVSTTKGEKTQISVQQFFHEVIVSYLAEKMIQFKPGEIEKLKSKANRLFRDGNARTM